MLLLPPRNPSVLNVDEARVPIVGEAQSDHDEHDVKAEHQSAHLLGHLPLEGHDEDEHGDQHAEQQHDRATQTVRVDRDVLAGVHGAPQ